MIVVTGGSGFIGSALMKHLVSQGNEVRGWDIVASPRLDPVNIEDVDVTDSDRVARAMRGVDTVFHLAGPVAPAMKKAAASGSRLQANGTKNVLQSAAASGVRRVVLASSFYVYQGASSDNTVDEETRLSLDACDPFAKSKLEAELVVTKYAAETGMECSIARIGSAFGGEGCSNVLLQFLRDAAMNRCIEVWGNGQRRNQYTFVDDIAQGLSLLARAKPMTANLISPEVLTTAQAAESIAKFTGAEVTFSSSEPEIDDTPYMSPRRALTDLHWEPTDYDSAIRTVQAQIAGTSIGVRK